MPRMSVSISGIGSSRHTGQGRSRRRGCGRAGARRVWCRGGRLVHGWRVILGGGALPFSMAAGTVTLSFSGAPASASVTFPAGRFTQPRW